MKRVLFYLMLLVAFSLVKAQNVPPQDQLPILQAYPYTPQVGVGAHTGSARADYVVLDYFTNEYLVGADPYYVQWDMNTSYDVHCTPFIDTVGHETLNWAGVRFDSIFDATTGAVYQPSAITSLQVDSLYLYIGEHTKTTAQPNYLIFKIMSVSTANLNNGYRGLSVTNKTVNNPLLWSDTLELTSSLGSGGLTTLTTAVRVNGNVGLNLGTATNGFIVLVEFVGPEADIFRIADMNDFACGLGSFVVTSKVPNRSLSYVNYATYSSSNGCTDLSTVGELSSTSGGQCNKFYRQNIGVAAGVTISASLSADASTSASSVCAGSPFTLSASISGGTGNYSYSWSGGPAGTVIASPSSSSTNVTLPFYNGNTTFFLAVTDLGTNTTVYDAVSVTASAIQVDLPSVSTCNYTNITATVSGNTAGVTYTWNPSTFPSNNTYNGASPGNTYSVTVTNSSGCSATDQVTVGSTLSQIPSFVASTNQVCVGSSINFTNTSTNTNGWSWNWLLQDNSGTFINYIATATNASYTFNTSGAYNIILEADSGGCSVTSAPYPINVLPSSHPSCGGGPVSSCPGPAIGVAGFRPAYNSLPCMVNNVPYMETIELEVPNRLGFSAAIEYIEIDRLLNLPCGITYSLDRANGYYEGGEVACITLMGTPNDVDGQYPLFIEGYYMRDDRSSATYTYDMHDDFDSYDDTSFLYYTRVSPNTSTTCADVLSTFPWLDRTASCTTPRPLGAGITAVGSGNSICAGRSFGLEVNAAGGTGSYTYSWSTGSSSRVIYVSPANTTTYSLTVNDGSNIIVDTFTVHVLQDIIPTVSLSSSPMTLCDGGSFTFTANVVNGGNHPSYYWYINGVEVGNGQQMGSSYTSPILTAGTVVTVNVYSSLTCSSIYGTTSVIIASCGGALTATLDRDNVDICPSNDAIYDGSAIFVVAANGGSGNYTYSWSPTTGVISGTDQASITVMPGAGTTTTYTVTVTDGSSSVTDNVTVSVFPGSQITAGADVSICGMGSATLSASGGAANTRYYWTPSDDLSCEYCQYPVAEPWETTLYSVSSRDVNGCHGSDEVVVSVTSTAAASVSIAPETGDVLCVTDSGQNIVALPVNAGYGSFQWKINGQVVSNNSYDKLWVDSIQVGDEISCLMTSDLSCVINATATSNTLVVSDCSVGILDIAQQSINISVMPNPSNGVYNVTLKGTHHSATFEVFNVQGQLIKKDVILTNTANIDLSNRADGVYIMRVTTDKGVATKKLIKR